MERIAPLAAAGTIFPGFFGKLPSRGDFITRGLSPVTVTALDSWISRSLVAGRTELAEAWSIAWAAAPVWHFNLPARQCGPLALRGLLLPSTDRIGRHFALIAAAEIPAVWSGSDDGLAEGAFHAALESDCQRALMHDATPDMLFDWLCRLPAPAIAAPESGQWWTAGGDHIATTAFECETLPDEAQFIRMVQD